MKFKFSYEIEIGKVTFVEENGALTHLTLAEVEEVEERETPFIQESYEQLLAYLAGARKTFNIPLAPQGTTFQKQVWQELQKIPYGATRSYKQIAEKIGNPKACRAIGMANNKNPIFIMIPCHRVIGTNGKLIGYGGGVALKEQLLNMEQVQYNL